MIWLLYLKTRQQNIRVQSQMSFLGKIAGSINNTISNTLTGAPSNNNTNRQPADPAQSKRRDKIIKQFEAQVKKLREDNDFINKAYEQLEAEHHHAKENYKNVQKIVKQSLEQVSTASVQLAKQLKSEVIKSIFDQLQAKLGETIEGDHLDEKQLNLQLKLDCTGYLQQQYSLIIEQFREDLCTLNNKQALQELGRVQEQARASQTSFREQLDKVEKEYKNKVSELSSTMIDNQKEYELKIRDMKENSDIITTELKNMLAKEKENFLRVDKELSANKLAQDKYQKQIFSKCEENNSLVSKNKELASEIQKIKANLQTEQSKAQGLQLEIEQVRLTLETKVGELENIELKNNVDDTQQVSVAQLRTEIDALTAKNIQLEKLKLKHEGIISRAKSPFNKFATQMKLLKQQLLSIRDVVDLKQTLISNDQTFEKIKQLIADVGKQKQAKIALQMQSIFQQFSPRLANDDILQRMIQKQNMIENLSTKLIKIKQLISRKQQKFESTSSNQLEQIKTSIKQKDKQLEVLKKKCSEVQLQLEGLRSKLQDSVKQGQETKVKLTSLEQKNIQLERQLLEQQKKSAGYLQIVEEKNIQIEKLQANLEKQQQKIVQSTEFVHPKDKLHQADSQTKQGQASSNMQTGDKQPVSHQPQAQLSSSIKIAELQRHIEQTKLVAVKEKQSASQAISQLQEKLSHVSSQLEVRMNQIREMKQKLQTFTNKDHEETTSQTGNSMQVQNQQKIESLETKLSNISKQIESYQIKLEDQSKDITNLRSINQQLRSEKDNLIVQVNRQQSKLEGVIQQSSNAQNTLQRLQNQIDSKDQFYSSLLQIKQGLESQINELKNNTAQNQIDKDQLLQKYQKQKMKWTEVELQMRLNIENSENAHKKLELEKEEQVNTIRLLQVQFGDIQKQKQHLEKQISHLQEEKQEMKADIDMMKEMTTSLDQQYLELQKVKEIQSQYHQIKLKFEAQLETVLNQEGIQKLKLEREQLMNKVEQLERSVAEHVLRIPEFQLLRSASAEAKHSLNMQIDLLNEEVIYKNNLLAEQQGKFALMVEEYETEKSLKNQELENINKKNTELENDLSYLKEKSMNLESEVEQTRKMIQTKTAEAILKQKQYVTMKSKKEEIEENSKKQISSLKNKCNKLEHQFSEGANSQRELKDKISKLESTINQYKKSEAQWLKNKDNFNQREIAKQEDLANMRAEMEKLIVQTAEKLKKQKQAFVKEMSDRELIFKSEKNEIERKYANEIEKMKTEILKRQMKNLEIENESKSLKSKLTQQKRAGALLNAKIQEMKGQHAKMDSVETQNLELKKKLLMKQEELKKVFVNMSNLKSTIEQLEGGIETYQAYAEQKNREVQQITSKYNEVQLKYKQLKHESASYKQKLSSEYHIDDEEEKKSGAEKSIERRDIILPIKRLILKYFDTGATYEQKANTLSTLSEVLELDKKQGEVLKRYKTTRLASIEFDGRDKLDRKEPGIQRKFFEFLTSDK